LKLELHPQKSKILKLEKGIDFLGFRIFYHHKLLGTNNNKRFERKLKEIKKEYVENKIQREQIIERLEGWLAYAKNADTYKKRKETIKKFNKFFPARTNQKIISVKKHENINQEMENAKADFTTQKTLQLFNQKHSIQEMAKIRGIKESTVWEHLAKLVEHHQLKQNLILSSKKIKEILKNIKTPDDKLKDIKERIADKTITYNEINIVLSNIKGKQKKKSINYYVNWYKKTNCHRKCYYNKAQRQICRIKFQQLIEQMPENKFTKNEFLEFFNNHTTICILSKKEKEQKVSWKQFQQQKNNRPSIKNFVEGT